MKRLIYTTTKLAWNLQNKIMKNQSLSLVCLFIILKQQYLLNFLDDHLFALGSEFMFSLAIILDTIGLFSIRTLFYNDSLFGLIANRSR
mmetsp:Transcript_4190/g.5504  ORF Transcript_4190/g.5504 Transcript_4190/m.5504 type:complete len:89 (-) Transcript_4190:1374-1640(-)